MSAKTNKPRHVRIDDRADGTVRYVWVPTKPLKERGFIFRRLSDDRAIAFQQAEALNSEVDKQRSKVSRNIAMPLNDPATVNGVIARYTSDEEYTNLKPSTKRSYDSSLREIARELGKFKTVSITPVIVKALKQRYKDRPYWGNHHLRVLRILFSYAYREGLHPGPNPVSNFRQMSAPARTSIWDESEITLFCDGNSTRGIPPAVPELVLAMRFALYTGQRQSDLLALRRDQIHTNDGMLELRQSKTGQQVWVPLSPDLATLVAHQSHGAPTILVAPNGCPWKADHFKHVWKRRAVACGIEGRTFHDLRRTAIAGLAAAGCTAFEIAAVSGHSYATIQSMMEVYAPRRREDATTAFDKLAAWSRPSDSGRAEGRQ